MPARFIMYKRWKCECAPISRSIFEPTYIFSLIYTVPKIWSISYPYQCLFAPSAQEGMRQEKNLTVLSQGNENSRIVVLQGCNCNVTRSVTTWWLCHRGVTIIVLQHFPESRRIEYQENSTLLLKSKLIKTRFSKSRS